MFTFDETTFGQLNAEDYDETQDPGTTDQAVAFISNIAGKGRILELAIGTGRVALPLAAMGHRIEGIEGSVEMVDKMRAKAGGAEISVHIGDMTDVAVAGPFDHIFLIFNTLFNLPDQAAQCRLFENVAARLAPGGSFLIEAFVPDLSPFRNHQSLGTRRLTPDSLWIEAVQHDPVAQTLHFQRARISGDGIKLVPLPLRYAYPPEMDLMARLAGLNLRARWGGWQNEAFTADSKMQIALYEKPMR